MTDQATGTDRVNVFAHSRRQRILRLLTARPEFGRSLAALQAATGLDEAPLMRHLAVMERQGLITRDIAGRHMAGPHGQTRPFSAMARAARRAHLAAMPARKVA